MNKASIKSTVAARHPGQTDAVTLSDLEFVVDELTLQDDFDTDSTSLAAAEADIDTLQSDMTTAQSDINTAEAAIDLLEAGGLLEEAVTAAAAPGQAIAATTGFVSVTSADANDVVVLPAPVVGKKIRGWVGANGFEMRTGVAGRTINNVDCETQEAAIPATTKFEVECVTSTGWILACWDELGAPITAIIPD